MTTVESRAEVYRQMVRQELARTKKILEYIEDDFENHHSPTQSFRNLADSTNILYAHALAYNELRMIADAEREERDAKR